MGYRLQAIEYTATCYSNNARDAIMSMTAGGGKYIRTAAEKKQPSAISVLFLPLK